jgi:glycosyltransferase involved in cell wall biosynthesis
MMIVEAAAGGTGRHVRELSCALALRGLDVTVVYSPRRDPSYAQSFPAAVRGAIRLIPVDMRREVRPLHDFPALWSIFRAIVRIRPQVVHLHGSKAGALGRMAAAAAGCRSVIYTPHAFAFLDGPGLASIAYRWLEARLARLTDHLIAVSPSEERAALRELHLDPAKVTTIPNGVRRPNAARAPSRSPHLRLGFLGRLERQKDPLSAVRLAAILKRRGASFSLEIGGDGSLAECVRAFAVRLGVADRVHCAGYIHDVESFYARIDALVVPSRYEGLPYAVLDAMARGVPVLGFDVPGVADAVASGRSGRLVPRGDLEALASAVETFADSPAHREALGREAQRAVAARFVFDEQIEQTFALYRKSAARARRGTSLRAAPRPGAPTPVRR